MDISGKLNGTHRVEIEVAARCVPARVVGEGRLREGSPALVLVRPYAVSLVAGDDAMHNWSSGWGNVGARQHEAVVREAAFRGSCYEQVVETVGGGRLSGIRHHRRMAFGTTVGVALDPSGCLAAGA